MATVYLAEDLKHRRKVAIKVLRPELAASLGVERFVREIEIAANLTHPHILPLHDSGAEGGYRDALLRYAETLATRPEAAERLSLIVAGTYAWAGEKERTLEWLELAHQAHALNLPGGTITPDFALVHDDPRYHDLQRRIGLPE